MTDTEFYPLRWEAKPYQAPGRYADADGGRYSTFKLPGGTWGAMFARGRLNMRAEAPGKTEAEAQALCEQWHRDEAGIAAAAAGQDAPPAGPGPGTRAEAFTALAEVLRQHEAGSRELAQVLRGQTLKPTEAAFEYHHAMIASLAIGQATLAAAIAILIQILQEDDHGRG